MCVRERECVKTQGIEDWSVFTGSLWLSISWSDACALHMTGMRRVRTGWRQLVFASISRVRPSHETHTKHFVLSNCHFWYTLSMPTLFIPTLPTDVEECFWEKTLATNLGVRDCDTHISLHNYLCIFLNSYLSIFHIIERLIVQTLTTPF